MIFLRVPEACAYSIRGVLNGKVHQIGDCVCSSRWDLGGTSYCVSNGSYPTSRGRVYHPEVISWSVLFHRIWEIDLQHSCRLRAGIMPDRSGLLGTLDNTKRCVRHSRRSPFSHRVGNSRQDLEPQLQVQAFYSQQVIVDCVLLLNVDSRLAYSICILIRQYYEAFRVQAC